MTGELWHPGCPVPLTDLRLLTMRFHDFDGAVQQGRMVVNRTVAKDVIGVFRAIFEAGFPIQRMDVTDLYPPQQRPERLRDVTSSFNCRNAKGSSSWSQHAYGLAVDINPQENPYVKDGTITPQPGKAFVDRSQDLQGMIKESDPVVSAFDRIEWGWGGRWHTLKDYMHFSLSGT